jgi:prepilin-type N-terminal cleavage/methylation domain-containing protein
MRGITSTSQGGFTLIEMMVALAIGMIVIASVAGTFTAQTRQNKAEEEISHLNQSVRGALDMISRELMQAGYKAPGGSVTGVTYSTTQLLIQADLDGNGTVDSGTASLEYITYAWDSANLRITRQLGSAGTAETVADNITACTFTYKDASNATTTASASIRKVTISITGRTAKPDPSYTSNGGYRTYQLSADITPPNLAL